MVNDLLKVEAQPFVEKKIAAKVWQLIIPFLKNTLLFDLDNFEGKDEDIY